MKDSIICSLILLTLIFNSSCSNQNTNNENTDKRVADTVYTIETVRMTYGYNPEKALVILDSAKLLGNISNYQDQFLHALIYSNTLKRQHLDSAMLIAETLLEHDSLRDNPADKEELLNILISISRRRKDDEHYLRWAMEKADFCREEGETTEALRMDAEIGFALTHLGRTEEGIAQLDKVIRQLDTKNSIDRLDALIIAIKRKITIMKEQKHIEEVIPLAELIINRMDHYQENTSKYAEDSYRLPAIAKDRARYVDFTYAQANGFLAEAYAKLGETQKAKHYLNLVEKSDYGKYLSSRNMMVPTYYAVGEYDKMLQVFEEKEQAMGADTINIDYANFLHYRALLADKKSQYKEASNYWKRYSNLDHLLNDSLLSSEAQKYASQYRQHEQQLELERQQALIERMNISIIAIVFIAILAISFSVYIYLQRKELRKKNSVLVKEIQEAVRFKTEYENLKKNSSTITNPKKDNSITEQKEKKTELEVMNYQELYNYLSENIIRNKLFLNPMFDRQAVIELFHISEKQVGAAFSKGSKYGSLPGFIREQRLLYACDLLLKKPELSISEICMASGFSNHSRFSIDFKKRFSISPTDYRIIASKEHSEEYKRTEDGEIGTIAE